MNRALSFFLATALASSALFACNATLTEGCLSGPCEADKITSVASSGSGGAGGDGAGGEAIVCDPSIPTTGEFPCDVFQVLTDRCFECHQDPPLLGAPFPLLKYEYVHEDYVGISKWKRMKTDIESGFMPFGKDDLVGAELKTMQDWFAQCAPPAPAGTGCE